MIIMTIFRLFKPPKKEELCINIKNIFKLDETSKNETLFFTQFMAEKIVLKNEVDVMGTLLTTLPP